MKKTIFTPQAKCSRCHDKQVVQVASYNPITKTTVIKSVPCPECTTHKTFNEHEYKERIKTATQKGIENAKEITKRKKAIVKSEKRKKGYQP